MSSSAIDERAEESVPSRVEGASIPATGVDAMERFLLDQVDGRTDVAALSDVTMMEEDAVRRILLHLTSLGIVSFKTNRVALAPAAPAAPPPAAPETVAADIDMDPVRGARINHISEHLPLATHYEMLGVPPDADKATIKKAYFALSKEFHPDMLHGRRIGAYKGKMEVIFRRITDAHDALTRQKRRDEYDAELARAKRRPYVTILHPVAPDDAPKQAVAAPAPSTSSSATAAHPAQQSSMGMPRPNAAVAPSVARPLTPPAAPARPAAPAAPPSAPTSSGGTSSPIGVGRALAPPVAPAAPAAPRPPSASLRPPSTPGSPRPVTSGLRVPSVASANPVGSPQGPLLAGPPPTSGLRAPTSSASAPRPPMAASPSISGARPVSTPDVSRPGLPPTSSGEFRAPLNADQAARMARDLARQTGHVAPQPTPAPPAGDPSSAAERERSLKRALHGASQLTGSFDRVAQFERQALQLELTGDLQGALSCLRAAIQFDSSRLDLRATHDRIDRALAVQEGPKNREKARIEEKNSRYQTAFAAWSRVCLGAADDFEAHLSAARCCFDGALDLRQAKDFAQRAVDLRPDEVEPRVLLARIFRGAGMRLNAVRELEAAAKLDPGNQVVKTLQRDLK